MRFQFIRKVKLYEIQFSVQCQNMIHVEDQILAPQQTNDSAAAIASKQYQYNRSEIL